MKSDIPNTLGEWAARKRCLRETRRTGKAAKAHLDHKRTPVNAVGPAQHTT